MEVGGCRLVAVFVGFSALRRKGSSQVFAGLESGFGGERSTRLLVRVVASIHPVSSNPVPVGHFQGKTSGSSSTVASRSGGGVFLLSVAALHGFVQSRMSRGPKCHALDP